MKGNWGCGAFRGDPELKSCIQWIAASCGNDITMTTKLQKKKKHSRLQFYIAFFILFYLFNILVDM